jgi:TrpR-related protein YerC/YecD
MVMKLHEAETLLARALASIETSEEAMALVLDLMTPREVVELARRLEVARLLEEGVPYKGVSSLTGASSTTVSRVSKCLREGSGGYALVLTRLAGADTDAGQSD